jgi:8-oxo-dGTP pyrophosphatase MutT (NUDIX family)
MATAQRELREETGLVAREWEQLGGEIHLSNCFSAERGFLYIARGLSQEASSPDHTEQLEVRKIPFAECLRMVNQGEIKDSLTIIAVLRVAGLLQQEST